MMNRDNAGDCDGDGDDDDVSADGLHEMAASGRPEMDVVLSISESLGSPAGESSSCSFAGGGGGELGNKDRGDGFFQNLFEFICDCYGQGSHCDVRLYARKDCGEKLALAADCHSLVLCSVVPTMKKVLLAAEADPVLGLICVYLPDLTCHDVKSFVDAVYAGLLSSGDEFALDISQGIADSLGMLAPPPGEDEEKSSSSLVDGPPVHPGVSGRKPITTTTTTGGGSTTTTILVRSVAGEFDGDLGDEMEIIIPQVEEVPAAAAAAAATATTAIGSSGFLPVFSVDDNGQCKQLRMFRKPAAAAGRASLTGSASRVEEIVVEQEGPGSRAKKVAAVPLGGVKRGRQQQQQQQQHVVKKRLLDAGDVGKVVLPSKRKAVEQQQQSQMRWRRGSLPDGVTNRQAIPTRRKMDAGPNRYIIDQENSDLIAAPEQILEALCRNSGALVATSDHCYATQKIINDKFNVITASDGTPRQFRMKLPDKAVVALVAVGIRDGRNYMSTLACNHPDWREENSFVNLIEVIKHICGTSFGFIMRHSRIREPNADKLSKSVVDSYKEQMAGWRQEELERISAENKEFLSEYDAEAEAITFHHLPQSGQRMVFYLAEELPLHEVSDYALISGDDAKDLTVQSLFNFVTQKCTNTKAITIMLDTLSCFVGCGNVSLLTNHPLMKDTFDTYATKTCQLLAIQELDKSGREKCRDLIKDEHELSSENEFDAQAKVKDEEEDLRGDKDGDVVDVDLQGSSKVTKAAAKWRKQTQRRKPVRRKNLMRGDPGDELKRFPCKFDGCSRAFDKETERAGHIARVHGKAAQMNRNTKMCPPCGKLLPNQRALKEHLYYHHTKKECPICHEEFPGAYFFYYHNTKVHSDPHTCDICGLEFRGKEKLKVHKINKHLEDHQKPYVCSLCGKGYAHKTKLQSHQMNVHIRSRPYKCRLEGCEADFNELSNRNAHERTVHKFNYRELVKTQFGGGGGGDEQPDQTTAANGKAVMKWSVGAVGVVRLEDDDLGDDLDDEADDDVVVKSPAGQSLDRRRQIQGVVPLKQGGKVTTD